MVTNVILNAVSKKHSLGTCYFAALGDHSESTLSFLSKGSKL